MRVRADLDRKPQVTNNLSEVKSRNRYGRAGAPTATQLMDRVTSLAYSRRQHHADGGYRQSIALAGAPGILQQLVGLSQTAVQGRLRFQRRSRSISFVQSRPSRAKRRGPPDDDQATRQITDATGVSFTVADTAQDIFDHRNPDDTWRPITSSPQSTACALASRATIRLALSTALNSIAHGQQLSQHATQLLRLRAKPDSGARRIIRRTTRSSCRRDLSQTQDADITQAAVALAQSQHATEDGARAEASAPRTSLFDFLG